MTTRSLLDAMRSGDASNSSVCQSPLQRAQSLVSKDDYQALKPLLALPNGEGGSIKETDFVIPDVKENLLHVS